MEMSGGEAMIRATLANGIDTIFGIPGAQIYPMFDAMHRLQVRTIVTRHEQGAAYMAFGAAKATGKPAAFAVVPGPGVLNTTAALCTAMGTCTPVLCLTGQVPSTYLGLGRGHLHELSDQAGTLRTLIKDAVHISNPATTASTINQAVATMLTGRRGPVAVEMCWDTMAARQPIEISPPADTGAGSAGSAGSAAVEIDLDAVSQAADTLAAAERPLIVCGAGAQHAHAEVQALAELLDAPVTAFRSGRGVVAEDHPLGVSSLAGRALYDQSDVLIGIGSRLEMPYMRWRSMNEYERKPSGGPTLIRIDVDPAEFDRLQPDIGIAGDAAAVCSALLDQLDGRTHPKPERRTEIAAAKLSTRQLMERVQPQLAYLDVIRDVLPRDGFFVPELSQVGFTSYFGFPVFEPRTYVTEGFQGTLGFGMQTALGVKVACPDKAVVCVTGDGGFMFGVAELATAVAHNIGVVTLVFNNESYGNVRRDQLTNFEGRVIGADLVNPDFVQLAESFGAAGYRVNSPDKLRPVLEKALANDKPAIIEVTTPRGSETSPWEFIHMPTMPH